MANNNSNSIAIKIRKARLQKKMTQVVVAQKSGISETYFAQIERGEKNPTISVISKIIDVLGVSSKDILGK